MGRTPSHSSQTSATSPWSAGPESTSTRLCPTAAASCRGVRCAVCRGHKQRDARGPVVGQHAFAPAHRIGVDHQDTVALGGQGARQAYRDHPRTAADCCGAGPATSASTPPASKPGTVLPVTSADSAVVPDHMGGNTPDGPARTWGRFFPSAWRTAGQQGSEPSEIRVSQGSARQPAYRSAGWPSPSGHGAPSSARRGSERPGLGVRGVGGDDGAGDVQRLQHSRRHWISFVLSGTRGWAGRRSSWSMTASR